MSSRPGGRTCARMESRLFHVNSRQHYIVVDDKVYSDLNDDGKVSRADVTNLEEHEILIQAAAYFLTQHDPRVPGIAGPDGSVINCGLLNRVEKADFEGAGTWAARPLVQEHLSFFDPRGLGRIGLWDNYRSWRDLGFGVLKSLVQTAGSALFFGWRQGGTIVVDQVPRPQGSTGSTTGPAISTSRAGATLCKPGKGPPTRALCPWSRPAR